MDKIKEYGYNRDEDGNNGVYMIRHKITNKRYIGESSRLDKRFGEHCSLLRSGKHYNKEFQKDFNEFFEEIDFLEYRILATCPKTMNTYLESFYIYQYGELVYKNKSRLDEIFLEDVTKEDSWINYIEYKNRMILERFIKWYVNFVGFNTESKYIITDLIERGVEESRNGQLFEEYPFLKSKFHKSNNTFINVLDYIGLAIIKLINLHEEDKSVYNNDFDIYSNQSFMGKGLVAEVVYKLNEIGGEFARIMISMYEFGHRSYVDKTKYKDTLDRVCIMDRCLKIDNIFDCVLAYILLIFLSKNF